MMGNYHVRFLGGKGVVTPPTYPVPPHASNGGNGERKWCCMKKPVLLVILCALVMCFCQPPAKALAHEEKYLRAAAQSAIFIYDPSATPCAPVSPGTALLPLGSGFVVGFTPKGAKPQPDGKISFYKFLVTAQHVVGDRDSIIVRLNRTDKPEFACFTLSLARQGNDKNVYALAHRPQVDLIALRINDLPNTDPTVFDYSLILDDNLMKTYGVIEGTDVFAVGYLYGYSGKKQNFPVTKFGKIALLTDEEWYHSGAPRNFDEKAYLVEMHNVPGLSGAPVMLQSPQFRIDKAGKFQFRKIAPFIIGVIKGLLKSPVGGTQGVAAIEPAAHLKELMKSIADEFRSAGVEVELGPLDKSK